MFGYQGGLLSLIVLAIDIYAIINVVESAETTGTKVVWTVVVIAMPLLGAILWYFFGPRSAKA